MTPKLALHVASLMLAGVLTQAAQAQSWTPPLGIPAPGFGITAAAPARPAPWTSEVTGFYYVDSASGCSDSRTYGYSGAARCTIPSTLSAGAYVEVHGAYKTSHSFSWSGSATNPIFISGQDYANRPLISAGWNSNNASYVVLQYLHFGPASSSANDFGLYIPEGSHHIAIRDSEFSGNLNATGGLGVGTWSYSGSSTANNIVIKGVNFHDIGDVTNTGDRDAHCVTVNGSVNNLWLVDSQSSKCEGDAIQIEGQHDRGIGKIHHIYYGRNVAQGHKQSGGWVKHASDVIFSQNEVFNITSSSSSEGQCIGAQYNPQNVWFIFNKLHDCDMGIFIGSDDGSGDGSDAYIVGNVIYNVRHPADPTNIYNAGAISARGFKNIWAVNNTIYNSDGGINSPPAGINWRIYNNIIAGRTTTSGSEINLENAGSSVADNNLFYRSGGIKVVWSGSSFTTAAFSGKCATCLLGDPSLVNASSANFNLNSNSPAINKGASTTVYSTFQSLYGLSINYDFAGNARNNGQIDIGAFEYGGTPAIAPEAPSSVEAR